MSDPVPAVGSRWAGAFWGIAEVVSVGEYEGVTMILSVGSVDFRGGAAGGRMALREFQRAYPLQLDESGEPIERPGNESDAMMAWNYRHARKEHDAAQQTPRP